MCHWRLHSIQLLVLSVLFICAKLASAAGTVEGGFQNRVIDAIRAQFIAIHFEEKNVPAPAELEVLGSPTASASEFVVQGVHWDFARAALYLRMRCEPSPACTPFLVRVRTSEIKAEYIRQVLGPSGVSWRRGPTGASSAAGRQDPCRQTGLLVKAGRSAMLSVQRQQLKFTTPVIVLDCGTSGQRVRARTKKANKLFEAEVTGENLLTAKY
jgi:hypothetical protein